MSDLVLESHAEREIQSAIKKLEAWLDANNATKSELAKLLDVSTHSLRAWLTKVRQPTRLAIWFRIETFLRDHPPKQNS